MNLIKIDIPNNPQEFLFETEIKIRITDLNYVGHLGNDVFLSIIHEARAQFLKKHGYTELDIEGVATIVNDAGIIYKTQVHYGQTIIVKLAIKNPGHMSCDFVYLLLNKETGKEVARAKTGFAFLDYETGELSDMPKKFRALFSTQSK